MADAIEHQRPASDETPRNVGEVSSDEVTAEEYGLFVAALKKIYDGLDTPEHHLAYVRERLAAARAEP